MLFSFFKSDGWLSNATGETAAGAVFGAHGIFNHMVDLVPDCGLAGPRARNAQPHS